MQASRRQEMSTGPLGALGSAAGSPLAQSHGSDIQRAAQDRNVQERQVDGVKQAENAAGIGETDGKDNDSHERDADGRRIWEDQKRSAKKKTENTDEAGSTSTAKGRDASGERGNELDLSG